MNICLHCKLLLRVFFICALLVLSTSINLSYPPVVIQLLILPLMFTSVNSIIIITELITAAVVSNICYFFTDNMIAVNLPIISTATIILAYCATRNMAAYLTYIANAVLIVLAFIVGVNALDIFIIIYVVCNLLINFRSLLYKDDDGDERIAVISSSGKAISKELMRHVENVAKKERRAAEFVSSYALENYQYVLAVIDEGRLDYKKLKGKKVMYLYNAPLFDDNTGFIIFLKSIYNGAEFYGRFNIRRVIKKFKRGEVDVERVRVHFADFINGSKAALPGFLNLSPNFFVYKIIALFK